MGRTKGGAFGVISGKVANAVGSSWKGIATVRSLPESVANPKTTAQMAQRNKFSSCVSVARILLSLLVQIFWDPFSKKMSGYNAFIKSNIDCFDADGLATPADFKAAKGTLVGETITSLSVDALAHDLELVLSDQTGIGDALATDKLSVLYYNETKDTWTFLANPSDAVRSDGGVTIPDILIVDGNVLHVWCFFSRPDISKISDSVYETGTAVV